MRAHGFGGTVAALRPCVASYCRDVPLRTAGLLGTVTHRGGCQPAQIPEKDGVWTPDV